MHVKRVIYQVVIWKQNLVATPDIHKAEGNDWKLEDDQLVVDWCKGPIIPQGLVDILATVGVEDDDEIVEDYSEYQDQDDLNGLISEENESSDEEDWEFMLIISCTSIN